MSTLINCARAQQDICNNHQPRAKRSRALLSLEEESMFARYPKAQYLFKWEVINPKTDHFLFEVVTRGGGRLTGDTYDIIFHLEKFSIGDVTARWRKAIRRMVLFSPTRVLVHAHDLVGTRSEFSQWSQRHAG